MNQILRTIALCFAAGCAGALVRTLLAWGIWHSGFTGVLGAQGATALQPGVLYPRIVWGGLWGGLFLVALLRKSFWLGAMLAAVLVTLAQWVILPLWWHHGLHLAPLALLNSLLLNLVWAMATALLLRWI